jgi:hypothetical protein
MLTDVATTHDEVDGCCRGWLLPEVQQMVARKKLAHNQGTAGTYANYIKALEVRAHTRACIQPGQH